MSLKKIFSARNHAKKNCELLSQNMVGFPPKKKTDTSNNKK